MRNDEMKRRSYRYTILCACAGLLAACAADHIGDGAAKEAHLGTAELTGIHAVIEGGAAGQSVTRAGQSVTRAGTVTPLLDYVGRSAFVAYDQVTFTNISRTTNPFDAFTYPGNGNYEGIVYKANSDIGWERQDDGGPEHVYWTDATSPHTFIGYSVPQEYGNYWKKYKYTHGGQTKTYYFGAIGNPTSTTGADEVIDYCIDPYEKEGEVYKYRKKVNNDSVFTNPVLEKEDVVIAYDEGIIPETGGVAPIRFHHALSSVRVIVNISGFSAGASAEADNKTVVRDMRLLHQPTMYVWQQADNQAQALRSDLTTNVQTTIDELYSSSVSNFKQRKDMKLWIPRPEGSGTNQSKTFTFYGITTPQDADYMANLPDADAAYKKCDLKFTVYYPDPLNPTVMTSHTYTASLDGVYFRAGYNTTIHISLNHRNEKMTVGAEYENWQFEATPDEGQLKKNTTFLQDTERTNVTIADDAKATADDATWLYKDGSTVKDIYGHDGSSVEQAYQISTAYQLLSFAYEVQSGRHFTGQYVRLDADLTLQQSSDQTKEEIVVLKDDEGKDILTEYKEAKAAIDWIGIGDIGIGDNTHLFNGTFIGGNRYIYRLKGKPLFAALGENAKIEQLNVGALTIGNTQPATPAAAVEGSGLFADTNAGHISGSQVVGNVTLSGETSGAFVGSSSGVLFACYHIGNTTSTGATAGGLVGTNSGSISSCYQAGVVSAATTKKGIAGSSTGSISNTYFNSSLFTYDGISTGVTAQTTTDMTKTEFVTTLNSGIATWLTAHSGEYENYRYKSNPANYPTIEKGVITP